MEIEGRGEVLVRSGASGPDLTVAEEEQEVVQQHLAYMGKLIGEGTIERAGPF